MGKCDNQLCVYNHNGDCYNDFNGDCLYEDNQEDYAFADYDCEYGLFGDE